MGRLPVYECFWPNEVAAMSIAACAERVATGDPDRFAATMTVAPAQRAPLFVLYALNLEVAKAPWVTQEPMIAEMRLQWWRDVVAEAAKGQPARAHEVAGPLSEVVQAYDIAGLLDGLIAARRWDIYKDAFEDQEHMDAYLDQTAGHLIWAAAVTCHAAPSVEMAVRDLAFGHGVANLLRAVPALVAQGRLPLLDGRDTAVQGLARRGLERLNAAKRCDLGQAVPVARTAWQAETILKQAVKEPGRVAAGALGPSELAKRTALIWKTFRQRW